MSEAIKDSDTGHWVNKSPPAIRPYLQLSRLDRPVGYWLLTLPGWIGLAFASLSYGLAPSDLKWGGLILIGAIAMRGAGCTYNDIVDQDLDAQVERTAQRPLPAGTVSTWQAWIWLFIQCAIGLSVLLCFARFAQIISLCSIPLVAAYPFMKRITWWPQLWLGMTFNWAALVAYSAKMGRLDVGILILYCAMISWTVFYDTIYACQDIEDDAMIGIKSTAIKFGEKRIERLALFAILTGVGAAVATRFHIGNFIVSFLIITPFYAHLIFQLTKMRSTEPPNYLAIFKSNFLAGLILILSFIAAAAFIS